MPAMLSKLYHALLGAGVDDATATAAAEEAAQSDQHFAALDVKLTQLEGGIEARLTRLEAAIDRRFAQVDTRFATLEGHIGRLADNVKALSERMDSHFRIMYWILGVLVAAFLGLAWRVLS
jgi:uncharacterized protein YceH (UPF0502 family)